MKPVSVPAVELVETWYLAVFLSIYTHKPLITVIHIEIYFAHFDSHFAYLGDDLAGIGKY